jgi:N-acetylneuraminic acid mutarotase
MKTTFILILFHLFNLIPVQEQILEFKNLPDMPTARGAVSGATDGRSIYIINGFSLKEKCSGLIEKYDIAENKWSVLSATSIHKQFPSSAIIGNDLYVFNGDVCGEGLNMKMEKIDLSNGNISYLINNPLPAHAAGVAVWDGKLYSFGGKISNSKPEYSDQLHCFDPHTQKWNRLADMPSKKEAKGEFIDGRLYVIGGFSGKSSDEIECYDVKANKWMNLLKLPFGISANSVVAHGSKIYTLFDYTNQSLIGCYDVLTNTFTIIEQKNINARRHGGAFVIDDKLYIAGGNTTDRQNSCLSSLQVADLK